VPDMTTSRTYPVRGALVALTISIGLTLLVAVAFGAAAQAGTSNDGCTGSYGWPVKPFDRPHPIRGSFGDPRTIFHGPPTHQTLLNGAGGFSFHQGVDVSAPNGTRVYPVANGAVVRVTHEWIRVDCGNGRAFEYWHLEPHVHVGQRVSARETMLGTVRKPQMHVHLTQLQDLHAVNPVAPGRLSPYRDTTTPRILDIGLRQTETGEDEMPQYVRGQLFLVAEAVDSPALPVPGIWHDLPVTPARISWRIERWTGRVVVPERVARDVRESLPRNDQFWSTFARGTCQNMSVFGNHYSYLQAGRYLFKLTPGRFDTRQLRDGVYDLVVTAQDIAGNKDVRRLRFTVHNDAGWR
jgi:hypothetical protein